MTTLNEYHYSSSKWVNIQEPVKDVLQTLSKAIQTQALDIQALDKQLHSNYIPSDKLESILLELLQGLLSKEDGRDMIRRLDNKADVSDLRSLNERTAQLLEQLSAFGGLIDMQTQSFAAFNERLSRTEKDIQALQTHTYDRIIAYVDKQILKVSDEFERKLASKADNRMVESAVPQRLEELYRHLSNNIADIKSELNRKASKDEIQSLATNKADGKDIRELSMRLGDCISRFDMHQEVTDQVRPLVTAIASIERTIGLQEDMLSKQQLLHDQRAREMSKQLSSDLAQDLSPLQQQRVYAMIQSEFNDRDNKDILPAAVSRALKSQASDIVQDINLASEINRTEIGQIQADLMNELRKDILTRLQTIEKITIESRDRSLKTKQGVKEFASNVAKALGRKIERGDLDQLLQSYQSKPFDSATSIFRQSKSPIKGLNESRSRSLSPTLQRGVVSHSNVLSNLLSNEIVMSNHLTSDVINDDRASKQATGSLEETLKSIHRSQGHGQTNKSMKERKHGNIASTIRGDDMSVRDIESNSNSTDDNTNNTLAKGSSDDSEEQLTPKGDKSHISFGLSPQNDDELSDIPRELPQRHEQSLHLSSLMNPHDKSTTPSYRLTSQSINTSKIKSRKHANDYSKASTMTSPIVRSKGDKATPMASKTHPQPSNDEIVKELTANYLSLQHEFDRMKKDSSQHQILIDSLNSNVKDLTHIITERDRVHGNRAMTENSLDYENDWRLAVGDISLTMRRELQEKVGREEMYTNMRRDHQVLENQITELQKAQASLSSIDHLTQVQNDLMAVKTQILSSLTHARWLWTSGAVVQGGWVPWDNEVINSSVNVFSWKKGGSAVLVRLPGLYRITVSVFTSLPVAIQICLNGEPIITLNPDSATPRSAKAHPAVVSSKGLLDDQSYVVRRLRHSVGDVTCISVEEYVSLPQDGAIAVRFHSQTAAQAFLAIAKI